MQDKQSQLTNHVCNIQSELMDFRSEAKAMLQVIQSGQQVHLSKNSLTRFENQSNGKRFSPKTAMKAKSNIQ